MKIKLETDGNGREGGGERERERFLFTILALTTGLCIACFLSCCLPLIVKQPSRKIISRSYLHEQVYGCLSASQSMEVNPLGS